MPPLTITIEVVWPKHPSLAALEKAIFKALWAAGRQLLCQAFGLLEDNILAQGAGARQRRRRRYLLTRFGEPPRGIYFSEAVRSCPHTASGDALGRPRIRPSAGSLVFCW